MTPQTPIGRRQLTPLGQARGVALPWWNPDGATPGGAGGACVVAYEPLGAASYAASKVNIANPGTYDANDIVVPNWANGVGWTGTGTQYLDTGVIPADGYSMIVEYANAVAAATALASEYDTGAPDSRFGVWPNGVFYQSGQSLTVGPSQLSGIMGVAGNQGYRNGHKDGGTIGAWANAATLSLYILARHREAPTNVDAIISAEVRRFALYNVTLTETQMLARADAIWPTMMRLVVFGDSVTAGQAASTAANRWANILAAGLGVDDLVNSGVSGTVLQNTVQNTVATIGGAVDNNGRDNYVSRITQYSPDRVAILYGLNDLRLNDVAFTAAAFQNDLGEVVDAVIASGVNASDICIGSPTYIPPASYGLFPPYDGATGAKFTAYVAAAAAVAAAKGTDYADVYQAMVDGGGAALISGDGIHPNDAGHAVIAAAFIAAM